LSALLVVLLTPLFLSALGIAAAFHPSLRPMGLAARASASFAAGAVLLTVEAVIFSLARVPWTAPGLWLPAFTVSLAAALFWSRRPTSPCPRRPYRPGFGIAAAASLFAALAFAHLVASLATTRATSTDYLYFWGVKAVRFAQARAIDAPLLRWPFFGHAVPDYPPLAPVVGAWSTLLAGRPLWLADLLMAAVWLMAAVPVVLACLRRRVSDDAATAVTAFWTAALAISLAFSYSGGNAEAPLLFFLTVAGVALLCEERRDPPDSRFLPALALAGAVLTKAEGSVGAFFLVAGTLWRDRFEGRDRVLARGLPLVVAPASALALWFGFQAASNLPVGYRSHGPLLELHFDHVRDIASAGLERLGAGAFGISWLFPLAVLLLLGRDRRSALPALCLIAGLLGFLAFDYLHDAGDPSERIGWTLPRVSQPALSLLILSAGLACFSRERSESASSTGIGANVRLADQVIQADGSGTGSR
jgi:hypothetical protein